MADTITLPGAGEVKKEYVWAGGALVVGIVGFAWWRRSTSGGAAETPYYDTSELTPDSDYDRPGNPTGNVSVDNTQGLISTNAQWSQAVNDYLPDRGWEAKAVASAVGVYLQREKLDPMQLDIIKAAVGRFGPPPQDGPWPIQAKPGEPTTTPGIELPAPTNLRITGATRNTVGLAWDAVPGAEGYQIEWEGKTGEWHTRFDRTSGTAYTVADMPEPNETYILNVRAYKGSRQGTTAAITAKTTR